MSMLEIPVAPTQSNEQQHKQRLIKYVDALREAQDEELARDENVFLFGLDVDDHKGIQGSTVGLAEKYGKDRVFSTPLSEDAMTGVAIGAAMAGMRPIHVHIRMDFMLLCMNQLINMGAKSHYMYNGQVNVPLTVRTMIGRSWGQGGQHSQALHSLFCHIPGLKVVAPTNAYDAKACLKAAIRDDNPVIFIEHRLLYGIESYIPEDMPITPLGQARILQKGSDITIVAVSHMAHIAMRAHKLLAQIGISAEIIDPVCLRPLDIESIKTSAQKTGRVLILDNAWLNCGLSAEIMTQLVEHNVETHEGKRIALSRMGFADTTCPTTRCLEDHFYPSEKTVAQRVYQMVEPNGPKWEPATLNDKTELDAFKGPF